MPGQSPVGERIAALEAWRDEHKSHHAREHLKAESAATRRTIIMAAVIGLGAAIIGAAIGAIATFLVNR